MSNYVLFCQVLDGSYANQVHVAYSCINFLG